MSSGGSKKTTETTNTVTNQTSRPVTQPWMDQGFQDLFSRIGAFGNVDPQSLVAGASPLQQQAFQQASGLLGGGASVPKIDRPLVNGGPGDGYSPSSTGSSWQDLISQAAAMAGQTGGANLAGFQGYNPSLGTSTGYNPALLSQAAQVGPVTNAQAVGAGAAGLLDRGLEQYLNPYQGQVTDAYTADFDQNAGRTRTAQSAQAALNGAFSGSRYGIQEAQTEGELSRSRASGLASILQGGYDRATTLADADASRRQQANLTNAQLGTQVNLSTAGAANAAAMQNAGFNQQGLLANLDALNTAGQFGANAANQFGLANMDALNTAGQYNADAYNQNQQFNANQFDTQRARQLQAAGLLGDLGNSLAGNNRADLGLLSDLGAQQQQIDANQRTAGLSQLQALAQLYGAFPSQLFTGQQTSGNSQGTGTTTQTQNPGLLAQVGQGAQVAGSLAALFSDARLKNDIQRIGSYKGMGVYQYRYIWDDTPSVGLIAQEVAAVAPDAVSMGPGGFLMVDYGRV